MAELVAKYDGEVSLPYVVKITETSINFEAFLSDETIGIVLIGDKVTEIENGAIKACSQIECIKVDPENPKYDSREDCNAIVETKTNTLISGCKNTVIPESVTRIIDYAFDGCSSLTRINIPDGVSKLHEVTFTSSYFITMNFKNNSGCTSSNNWRATICDIEQEDGLMIKDNVAVICRKWATSVTIPNSVTSIGESAFVGCNIKKTIWLCNTPPSGYEKAKGTINYVANDLYTKFTSSEKKVYPYLSSMFEVDGIKYVPVSPSNRLRLWR